MQPHLLCLSEELFRPCILMQHRHLLICTCISSLQRHYGTHKGDQSNAVYKFLTPRIEGALLP